MIFQRFISSMKSQYNSKMKMSFQNGNRDFFIPPKRIFFKKGKLRIYNFKTFNGIRNGYLIICGICYFFVYKIGKKLYHFDERKWYGLIFYSTMGFLLTTRLLKFHKTFN